MLKKIISSAVLVLLSTSSFFANPKDSLVVKSNLKYIQPKIHSININRTYPALSATTTLFDPQHLIESAEKFDDNHLNFTYQYNVTKNYFVESFLSFQRTKTTVSFINYLARSGSILKIMPSEQNFWNLGLGGGYRLISENHKRLMDINFGLNFIYAQNTLGNNTYIEEFNYRVDNTDKTIEILFTQKELNNFIVGAYLGVAKEFRVKKGLHVHIAYQYHINSKILSKDEISYKYVDENISGKVDANNNLARSFLMLGLKYYVAKNN